MKSHSHFELWHVIALMILINAVLERLLHVTGPSRRAKLYLQLHRIKLSSDEGMCHDQIRNCIRSE